MTQRDRDMRASDADRNRVVARLRSASDEGRLDLEELDARLGLALCARTYGELDAVTSDLPARRGLVKLPTRAARGLTRGSKLISHARHAGVLLRPRGRQLLTAAAAAAAVAAPLTAAELGAFSSSGHVSRAGADSAPMPSWLQYDLRQENNPNAPHPPVYYVLKANQGEK